MRGFSVTPKSEVYVYKEPISMSCSFPRLTEMVEKTKAKPLSGDLFLFVNKKRTYLKVLFWAKGGMCIFAKKLPTGKFQTTDREIPNYRQVAPIAN